MQNAPFKSNPLSSSEELGIGPLISTIKYMLDSKSFGLC